MKKSMGNTLLWMSIFRMTHLKMLHFLFCHKLHACFSNFTISFCSKGCKIITGYHILYFNRLSKKTCWKCSNLLIVNINSLSIMTFSFSEIKLIFRAVKWSFAIVQLKVTLLLPKNSNMTLTSYNNSSFHRPK
jgi:hypothetical protein